MDTNTILNESLKKYEDIVEKETREYRQNAEGLHTVASEFLDDFIIIGHTIDEQRVIMRQAKTPRQFDGLMQLAKKVLIGMLMEEDKSE